MASGICLAAACAPQGYTFEDAPASASHCQNARLDSTETGTDCGGPDCAKCDTGEACKRAADCVDASCVANVCQDASCDNGELDDGETDQDCGGSRCGPCPDGADCEAFTDCASRSCVGAVCAEPSCSDEIKNGSEVAVDCGGPCMGCAGGTPCSQANDCASGACYQESCTAVCSGSSTECDGDYGSECETNTNTDAEHCGGCDMPCVLSHAEPLCSAGECQIRTCLAPYDDCDGVAENGCETNLSTSPEHCGTCEEACPALNGTATCSAGRCGISCDEGKSDCDPQLSGCETETSSNVAHCGGCDTTCTAASGATAFCLGGECGETVCPANRGNCNGMPNDSCEADFLSDPLNCGACGNKCVAERGTAACVSGKCVVQICETGFANCDTASADGGYATGCETNTLTSSLHCSGCNKACSISHAMSQCEAGVCQVKACSDGYLDCDADGLDCEVNGNTDAKHCGSCAGSGSDCAADFPNGNVECSAGKCRLTSCKTNFTSCDNDPSTCEVDLRSNALHCGDCATQCKAVNTTAVACSAGTCQPTCAAGFGACGAPAAGCADRLDTPTRCGSCTRSCSGSTPYCVNQNCVGVVLVNSAAVGAADNTLSLSHTLVTPRGQSRLVLVAVAALASTPARAQPRTATYGTSGRLRALRPFGTPLVYGTPSVYVSYYYLLDADLPDAGGTQTLTLDSSGTPDPTVRLIANVLEFKGVDQVTPLDGAKGTSGGCAANNPMSVSVAVPGSYLYDLAGGEWWGDPIGRAPANPGMTVSLNSVLNFSNLRAIGGFRGPVNAGNYTLGWGLDTLVSCNNAAQHIVAIRPGP